MKPDPADVVTISAHAVDLWRGPESFHAPAA